MIVKLLTEHHLEFLSLKGGCRGSSESTHVKMPHCWKSHVLAHIIHFHSRGHIASGAQNNRLFDIVLLRTHNTFFFALSSGGLDKISHFQTNGNILRS